jgi:hypothetical protein
LVGTEGDWRILSKLPIAAKIKKGPKRCFGPFLFNVLKSLHSNTERANFHAHSDLELNCFVAVAGLQCRCVRGGFSGTTNNAPQHFCGTSALIRINYFDSNGGI